MLRARRSAALLAVTVLLAAACGDDGADGGTGDRPTIVVTTGILGDVVGAMVGDEAEVTTVMPVGADPHQFSPSARQTAEMAEADAVVTNGAGLEEGLLEVVEAVESDGVTVLAATDAVPTLDLEDDHDGGDHEDEHHDGTDPHFFTDPARMATAVRGLADELRAAVPALDTPAFTASAEAYADRLDALDAEVDELLAAVPADDRVLVTNHETFSYFADRYGFEVIGTVIPGGTTTEGAGGGELAALAELMDERGVSAVFADTSSPDDLARALAEEVGGEVTVVELYSESLGGPGTGAETYVGLVRTNATLIADALS